MAQPDARSAHFILLDKDDTRLFESLLDALHYRSGIPMHFSPALTQVLLSGDCRRLPVEVLSARRRQIFCGIALQENSTPSRAAPEA